MNEIMAIFRKEIKTTFNSPIAFIVIVSFLVISNWLFFDYGDYPFFAINLADIRGLFNFASIVLLFFAPALSMRLIAEEKHHETLELLVTLPLTDVQIIMGKFLSIVALFAIILCGMLVAPITIANIGDLDMGIVFTSFVGFFLLGVSYLSLGLAASSFTKNQIVAYLMGLILIAVFFLINGISTTSGMMSTIIENLSIRFHYQNFFRGVIDSRDVLYFLSLSAISLLISIAALTNRKHA
jgi:ABC-2 type transport system permease protein